MIGWIAEKIMCICDMKEPKTKRKKKLLIFLKKKKLTFSCFKLGGGLIWLVMIILLHT